MASDIVPGFFGQIWRLFDSFTVPGFSFSPADMFLGVIIIMISLSVFKLVLGRLGSKNDDVRRVED